MWNVHKTSSSDKHQRVGRSRSDGAQKSNMHLLEPFRALLRSQLERAHLHRGSQNMKFGGIWFTSSTGPQNLSSRIVYPKVLLPQSLSFWIEVLISLAYAILMPATKQLQNGLPSSRPSRPRL